MSQSAFWLYTFRGMAPHSCSPLSLLVDVLAASACGPPQTMLLDIDVFQRTCSPVGTLGGQGVCHFHCQIAVWRDVINVRLLCA